MPPYDFHRVSQLSRRLAPVLKKEAKDERPFDMMTRVIRDDRPLSPATTVGGLPAKTGEQNLSQQGLSLAGQSIEGVHDVEPKRWVHQLRATGDLA